MKISHINDKLLYLPAINSKNPVFKGNGIKEDAFKNSQSTIARPEKKPKKLLKCFLASLFALSGSALAFEADKIKPLARAVSHSTKADDIKRRDAMEKEIRKKYVESGDGKIDWYEFADIVDYIASKSNNDEQFRRDLWHILVERLHKSLDKSNRGIAKNLCNIDKKGNFIYAGEQIHHYLGGTTGKSDLPTHLLNNKPIATMFEFIEGIIFGTGLNQGDLDLFTLSRVHRDDFLKKGRHVVGKNIRSILESSEPVKQ